MKKLITLLLACMLICAFVVPALADEVPTMTLSVSQSTVNPGDTITVTVSLSETANCTSAGLVISYDTAAFEMVEESFVKKVAADPATCKYNSRAGAYVALLMFENPDKVTGELFTFQLKVKDTAPVNANYAISGTPSARVNGSNVVPTVQAASVKVACEHKYDNACDTTCNLCGDTRSISHSYNDGVVTKDPTCAEEGVKTFTCSVCGHSYTEAVAKTTDHKYGNWEKVNDTTHKKTCSVCKDEQTAAHGYTSDVTKEPTCSEEGIKTFTCSDCGHSYTETIAKTTDHKYGNWEEVNDTTHKKTCSVCKDEQTASHSWNSGEVTKQPTCAEEGVKTYTCTGCGHKYTEAVAKTTDHKYAVGEKVNDSTHKLICSVCKDEKTEAHTYTSTVTKQPTCKDEGEKTYTCSCGHSYTEKIAKAEQHSYKSTVTKEATCKDEGVKTFTCSVCKDSYTEPIKKLAHKYDHDCDTDCNVCGETRTTEHLYSERWSYSEEGHWHECTVCHHVLEMMVHTPGPEATEEKDQICLDCGYVLKKAEKHTHAAVGDWLSDETNHWHLCGCGEILDQQEHTWDDGTLNDEGNEMTYLCTVCGMSRKEEVQPPTESTPPTEETKPAETKPAETKPSQTDPQEPTQPGQDDNEGGFPWIIVLIICILLLGVVVFAIIILLKKNKQEGKYSN